MHRPETGDLRADCGSCFGLCCVAPAFASSVDFAVDKPAGRACLNLLSDFRCGIHTELRQQGFRGCTVYDCFGAGQRVCQVSFGGRDWRQAPQSARQMFDVFAVMRQLHELLWLLAEALSLDLPADQADQADQAGQADHAGQAGQAGRLDTELRRAFDDTERLTLGQPEALLALDVADHRRRAGALLRQASERARAGARRSANDGQGNDMPANDRPANDRPANDRPARDLAGADLAGAHLAGADLRGANLRGSVLVAADLRRADLRVADLAGADVRDADLSGADLTGSIFLTQSQLDAAKGDAATALPPTLTRPAHWSASAVPPVPRKARTGRKPRRRPTARRDGGSG